jgi:hypothetical protein
MTLDDMEKGLIVAGSALIGGLVSLVRGGDIKRIEAIEKRQDSQETHTANELHALRGEMRGNHTEIMTILMERHK